MKSIHLAAGSRCLALALLGCSLAGCGSGAAAPAPESAVNDSVNPPPKTERARKAAEFEKQLRTKTRLD